MAIKSHYTTTTFRYNFDYFKVDRFSNRNRYVSFIEYTTLKMAFRVCCIGNDTTNVWVLFTLKDGFNPGSFARRVPDRVMR